MDYLISKKIEQKLRYKHKVLLPELIECFKNRTGKSVIDDREQHRTLPPTQWFIAQTATGRELKVVFIQLSENQIAVKTAYDSTATIKQIYCQLIRDNNQ